MQLRRSLGLKVVAALAGLFVAVFGLILGLNLWEMHKQCSSQSKASARRLAEAIYNGILHPMTVGDSATIRQQMRDFRANMKGVEVYVFGFDGRVTYSSVSKSIGQSLSSRLESKELRSELASLLAGKSTMQASELEINERSYMNVFKPMPNSRSCHHCHGASRKVLGGVMVRMDTTRTTALLRSATMRSVGVAAAGGVVAVLLVLVLVLRWVSAPLGRLSSLARAMADRDFTQEVKVEGRDELGELAQSMHGVCSQLGQVLGMVRTEAGQLSDGAQKQASAIEQIAAALEEVATTAKGNADGAAKARELLTQTTDLLKSARQAMRELEGNITRTSEASDDLGKIIKTIQEVAFQTNLLALNAAVEAARAGEAGAGFAVVADEVRNLALKAAEAASDSERLIGDMLARIKEGVELLKRTDGAYREVAISMGQLGELVEQVATSSLEQARGVEEVNQAISNIEQVVSTNADMAVRLVEQMNSFRLNSTSRALPAPESTEQQS